MSEQPGGHPHPHGGGLGEKVGPLPLKGWLIALGVVVVGAWYLRKRAAGSATAASAGAATPATAADSTLPGAGNLAGSTPAYVDTTGNGNQLGAGLTNNDWLTKAEQALVGQGATPYAVDQALQAYLTGQQLTAAQQALFDKAVQTVGPVPVPVPAMPGTGGAAGGLPGSGGGGGVGVAPPSSAPSWNPLDTPWAKLVNGVFADTRTGKPAAYGPQGQPGYAKPTGSANVLYVMPDGRSAYYDPTNFTYANGTVNTAGEAYAQQLAAAAAGGSSSSAPVRPVNTTPLLPSQVDTYPGMVARPGG